MCVYVCVCRCVFNDIYDSITFINLLNPNIVLPHKCQIRRLINKTPSQSTMPTGSEHVVGLCNAHL